MKRIFVEIRIYERSEEVREKIRRLNKHGERERKKDGS